MNIANKKSRLACMCLLGLLVAPALTLGFGGTITDGNASFTVTTFGDDPSADLTINGGPDRVVQIGWWYHLLGQTREFSFPEPDSETYTGNTSSFFWNDVNGGDVFSARLNTTLVQDGPSGARVHFMMTISNRMAADLTIDLINAAALQVDADAGDDSATLVNANNHIRFTSAGSSDFLEFRGVDFLDTFLVREAGAASVIALLNDTLETDFNNSGLPFGPGDATAALKTRVVAPQFVTFIVSSVLSVNVQPDPVRIGACCVPNVGCVDASEENDCLAQGGTFQGNGITCTINPCESACCMPDQSCQFLAQQPCQIQGGSYVPNSDCNDSDGDGRANGCDACPADAGKVEPGVCGCGVPDADTDADGTLDCNDGCPNDGLKTAPGPCGCGAAEVDSDADGVLDCLEECGADPAKSLAGVCGCGVPDTDSDGDGAADCIDECPGDPAKIAAGVCGCGVSDADSDGDGVGDLCDNCPQLANADQSDSNADGVGDACEPETPAPQSSPVCGTCAPGMPAVFAALFAMLLARKGHLRRMRSSAPFPPFIAACCIVLAANSSDVSAQYIITQIIDANGAGGIDRLNTPSDVAVDAVGNAYVTGIESDNAFKITPAGVITEIIDATGGQGHALDAPVGIAVDNLGDIYLAGAASNNAFRITPAGAISRIISSTGDMMGHTLNVPADIAVDADRNAFVTGIGGDNAFRISLGAITQIISAAGAGAGKTLDDPRAVAVDTAGNVYVVGRVSFNAFKITPAGVITQIINVNGAGGADVLTFPSDVAVDAAGNVYVTGSSSHNAFKITPGGVISKIIDATGDGMGHTLGSPSAVAVDSMGNVFVAGLDTSNVFRIASDGTITQIIDATGDGAGHPLSSANAIAVDAAGNLYVTGELSSNAFRLTPDADNDGVADVVDNCVSVANADQADADADGFGDACDNCPTTGNADQLDANGNLVGDVCESNDPGMLPNGQLLQSPVCGTCAPGVLPVTGVALAIGLIGRVRRRNPASGR